MTVRNAPFIVAPTCQSELKRTLRAPAPAPKRRAREAGLHSPRAAFGANGECRVSKRPRYGFEIVDAPRKHLQLQIFHQSKIYGESNAPAISKSFLRFNTKANTCDLSRPVTKDGIP